MKRRNIITITLAIAFPYLLIEPALASDVFGKCWYKMDRRGLGLSSPIIKVEYRNGLLLRNGKSIRRERLLSELRGGAALQPHPRVLLIIGRSDAEKVRPLVRDIERSGICKDSGCLYKFRVKHRM